MSSRAMPSAGKDSLERRAVPSTSVQPLSLWGLVPSLVRTSRPLGWIAALALVRTGMAYAEARDTWVTTGLSVSVTLPFCLYLFGLNDLADDRSDRVNPRKGSWIHGADRALSSSSRLARFAPWVGGAMVSIWLPWLPWRSAVILGVVMVVSWAYSCKPFRLKEVPIVDGLVTATIMIGLLGVGYFAGGTTESVAAESWAVAPTLAGLHIFASVADETSDKAAGHKTLAVRVGGWKAGVVAVALSLIGVATIPVLDYAEPIEAYMVFQLVVMSAWLLFRKVTMKASMVLLGTAGVATLVYMALVYVRR